MASRPAEDWKPRLRALLREPTVHFFAVGALLFVAHRLVVGNPRVITVTPGVKAELARRFQDHKKRAPSPEELEAEVRAWERDEALYREGLRDGLDRDDAAIRTVVADRVRARATLAVVNVEPTVVDLDRWFTTHRAQYEAPRRYDYHYVAFPKAKRASAADRDAFAQAVERGASPTSLGRPIMGATLTAEDMRERLGPELAARVQALPVGKWERLDNAEELLLLRVNAVQGGLPPGPELRKRLAADWSFAERQRAVDEAVDAIVRRYRIEEQP